MRKFPLSECRCERSSSTFRKRARCRPERSSSETRSWFPGAAISARSFSSIKQREQRQMDLSLMTGLQTPRCSVTERGTGSCRVSLARGDAGTRSCGCTSCAQRGCLCFISKIGQHSGHANVHDQQKKGLPEAPEGPKGTDGPRRPDRRPR